MKVGVIQSSYAPWRGYFDLIDDVDLFLFFDDAAYSKGSWRNRNKIKSPNGTQWLTVPVHVSLKNSQPRIEDVTIDYSQNWVRKHIRSLTDSYRKAPFFDRYAGELFELLQERHKRLSHLNVKLSRWILNQIAISTETKMSSEFPTSGSKSDRLVDLLKQVKATTYLSGPTAKAYLDREQFRGAGIALEYKSYEYPEYPQLNGTFVPQVSVLDLLFNCGPESKPYVKSLAKNEGAS